MKKKGMTVETHSSGFKTVDLKGNSKQTQKNVKLIRTLFNLFIEIGITYRISNMMSSKGKHVDTTLVYDAKAFSAIIQELIDKDLIEVEAKK